MNEIELAKKVIAEVVATANDINAYLTTGDAPMECHAQDVDYKLMVMKERLVKMILEESGLPVTILNGVGQ